MTFPQGASAGNRISPNASSDAENTLPKSDPSQGRQSQQKVELEKVVHASKHATVRGAEANQFKGNEEHGKRVVKYAFGDTRNSSNSSFPPHVKKKIKDAEKERQQGYQPPAVCRVPSPPRQSAGACRVTSPNRQTSGTFYHESPTRQAAIHLSAHHVTQKAISIKLNRSVSAYYEKKFVNSSPHNGAQKSGKADGEIAKERSSLHVTSPKVLVKEIQETKSSNAVTLPKKGYTGRSKTSSPRSRRPFSIAAESTSDTDPVETQRSVEFIGPSPTRFSRTREIRRQQYLATKFKMAVKNSKQTQTLVLDSMNEPESKESSTVILYRRQSESTTDATENEPPQVTNNKPFVHIVDNPEHKEADLQKQAAEEPKRSIPPLSGPKTETQVSDESQSVQENSEWKRAKARLRSTARSPSPPAQEAKHLISPNERNSLPFDNIVVGNISTRPSSASVLPSTVREKQVTDSYTQIDKILTKNASVQVKIGEKVSPERSPEKQNSFQRRVVSAGILRRENMPKEEPKKKVKKKDNTSGDITTKSDRSIHSLASGASSKTRREEKRVGSSKTVSIGGRRKASSESAYSANYKEKKTKIKPKESSSRIARFLRILSEDKEAIKSINKMTEKAKYSAK